VGKCKGLTWQSPIYFSKKNMSNLTYQPLSHYRAMWIFVMFDLPTKTKKQRHEYTVFRHFLLDHGFSAVQYSVYIRNAPSGEIAEKYIKDVKNNLPPMGKVNIIQITDKQYSNILSFRGEKKEEMPEKEQLSLF